MACVTSPLTRVGFTRFAAQLLTGTQSRTGYRYQTSRLPQRHTMYYVAHKGYDYFDKSLNHPYASL